MGIVERPSTGKQSPGEARGTSETEYRHLPRVLFVGTRESSVFDRIREENVLLRLRVYRTHALTRERFTFHGNGQKTSQKCVNGVSKKHRNGKGGETTRGTPVKRPNAYKETLPLLAGWWDGVGRQRDSYSVSVMCMHKSPGTTLRVLYSS